MRRVCGRLVYSESIFVKTPIQSHRFKKALSLKIWNNVKIGLH